MGIKERILKKMDLDLDHAYLKERVNETIDLTLQEVMKAIYRIFQSEIVDDKRCLADRKGDDVWISLKKKIEKQLVIE